MKVTKQTGKKLKTGIAKNISDLISDYEPMDNEPKMTIERLAEKSGVSLSRLKRFVSGERDENGNKRLPNTDDLLAIAKALDVSPYKVLTGNDNENHVVCEQLGLSNVTINRLRFLHKKNDNTLSEAINMFFADSEEIESENMTSAEELLFLFREFVLCPERELIVKTMNATNPAFALTRDEALQLRLINHLSEYKRNHKRHDEKKGDKEK